MGRNREPQILLSGSSTLFKDSFSALATESFKAREDNLEHLCRTKTLTYAHVNWKFQQILIHFCLFCTEECGTEESSGGMESSELESTVTESTCMTESDDDSDKTYDNVEVILNIKIEHCTCSKLVIVIRLVLLTLGMHDPEGYASCLAL